VLLTSSRLPVSTPGAAVFISSLRLCQALRLDFFEATSPELLARGRGFYQHPASPVNLFVSIPIPGSATSGLGARLLNEADLSSQPSSPPTSSLRNLRRERGAPAGVQALHLFQPQSALRTFPTAFPRLRELRGNPPPRPNALHASRTSPAATDIQLSLVATFAPIRNRSGFQRQPHPPSRPSAPRLREKAARCRGLITSALWDCQLPRSGNFIPGRFSGLSGMGQI